MEQGFADGEKRMPPDRNPWYPSIHIENKMGTPCMPTMLAEDLWWQTGN